MSQMDSQLLIIKFGATSQYLYNFNFCRYDKLLWVLGYQYFGIFLSIPLLMSIWNDFKDRKVSRKYVLITFNYNCH